MTRRRVHLLFRSVTAGGNLLPVLYRETLLSLRLEFQHSPATLGDKWKP